MTEGESYFSYLLEKFNLNYGEHSLLQWGTVILNEVKNLNKKIPRYTRNDTVFMLFANS